MSHVFTPVIVLKCATITFLSTGSIPSLSPGVDKTNNQTHGVHLKDKGRHITILLILLYFIFPYLSYNPPFFLTQR